MAKNEGAHRIAATLSDAIFLTQGTEVRESLSGAIDLIRLLPLEGPEEEAVADAFVALLRDRIRHPFP